MKYVFRLHAIHRMFERHITVDDVRAVVESGESITTYPDDTPYPSRLVVGWVGKRALHVVVADNPQDQEIIVITAYEPDFEWWDADFRRRKP